MAVKRTGVVEKKFSAFARFINGLLPETETEEVYINKRLKGSGTKGGSVK